MNLCNYGVMTKMNSNGSWEQIYEVQSKANSISVLLGSTDLANGTLLKEGPDGNLIFNKFKVDVENTAGLFNLTEKILAI